MKRDGAGACSADTEESVRRQCAVPAVYMRGGTSKGVFFRADVLPPPGPVRDRLLMRIIGSPDPYGKQIDGMGGATSSTSKVIIVERSRRSDCDVDYLFGQVSVESSFIDWSGNCGNLTAAVGPFAIDEGLVSVPTSRVACVRLWQANLGKRIVAHVPMAAGLVVEDGDFALDGVAFPASEIRLEFLEPGGNGDLPLLPSGHAVDVLAIPGVGNIDVTLINAGNPMVLVEARALGLRGIELQADINGDAALLARLESIRAHGAVRMGLAPSADEITRTRPATPKLALIAAPQSYVASSAAAVHEDDMDVSTRVISMGQLHHALPGTGVIAFAVAAAVPHTLMHRAIRPGWNSSQPLRLGHPSGTVSVAAEAEERGGNWTVSKAVVSRSARRLMRGEVLVPAQYFPDATVANNSSSLPFQEYQI